MNREDFPMLKKDIIYLDNGATTLKPKVIIDKMNKYYLEHTANIHRGDYDLATKTNELYDGVREIVREFVNCNYDEVIYTSGTTMSLNMVVFGYMRKHLKKGDEVLLNKAEHASNVLPWIKLSEEIGIVIKYVPLDKNYELTLDNIKKCVTKKTKVISLAHVSNVIGDVRDIKSIGKYCKEKGILFNVDGAQSVPHMKVDFKDSNIDFLSFSGHKMCGPTGVGILVGRSELLEEMDPICFGGGMNASFTFDKIVKYKSLPSKLEAGTLPIASIIGFGRVIDYLNDIGMDNIYNYEKDLRDYALDKLDKIENIEIYNRNSKSGIITFNYNDIFPQDLAIYLDKYNICVRAGNHCAKLLKDELKIKNTCRVSLYFYNTKDDIDVLVNALKNSNIKNELL